MPDIGIGIGVTGGKDAKEFVDALTRSLRLLGQQGHAQAIETQRAAGAAREYANALLAQSQSAKQNLQTEQQRLVAIRAAANETILSARKERGEALETARTYAKSAEAAAKYFRTIAEGRLKAAEAARIIVPGGPRGFQEVPDAALIAARKAELRFANESFARARALGESRINRARQVGEEEIKSARKTVIAQGQVITGARQQAVAQAQAATIAQRAAAVAQRAAQSAAAAFKNQSVQAANLSASMSRLRTTVLQLAASYVGIRTLFGAIRTGLEFNQIIESSTLGIAALITAEAKLENQQGHLLTGTNALKSAQVLAKDQLDKLRIAGIQTAATTEDLVRAFQEAVGAGVSVGLTLDQIRTFTVQIAQAAGAINLPFNQLNQEVRSILQGTIDRNSRIAKALQLTNEQVRLAKEEGRLADLLNEKFKAFNIAGLEVVKTFSGLKSTVRDAFQVLSGRAVEPLFDQIRIAGLKALSSIFDFRSAEVQASFQGLIRGAQEIFGEIGRLFSQALAFAVDRAQSLSRWLDLHRQQVKLTAAAISQMAKEFGGMVISIVKAVSGMGDILGGTNAVINVAHILSDIFKTIADNAKLIVFFLAGKALVTALGSIVSVITTLIAVSRGAAVGTALGGPLGGLAGSIVGLFLAGSAASKIFGSNQRQLAIETASVTTALDDQKFTIAGLVGEYITLQRQIHSQGVSTEEQAVLQKRLNDVIAKLRTAGGQQYLEIINKQTGSIEDQRKALLGLLRAEATLAAERQGDALSRIHQLTQELRLAEEQAKPRKFSGGITLAADPKALENVQRLKDELTLARAEAAGFTTQTERLTDALNRASEVPPKITREVDPNAAAGGEPAFIRQARAQLERLKAQLDAERAEIDAAFSRGSITAVEHIIRLGEVDRAEIDAEEKFLEAQRREAERKVDVAEKSKGKNRDERIKTALDALKAIDIQEVIFAAKRDKQRADEAAAILEATRETAEAKEAIEVRFLESTGQHLEAARREIENKNSETIREAIREFGSAIPEELRQKLLDANGPELGRLLTEFTQQLSTTAPIVLRLRLALDHEALEAQAKEIKSEIERITGQRKAEIDNINARFGRSGKLSSAEKQQKADLIAQANLQATRSADELRQSLDKMREAAAADPSLVTFIDGLIASLDVLREKSIEVDLEMESLKDGLRSSIESGIGGFLEGFIDKTFDVAEAFSSMVRNIIGEMNKLVSQLLAKRITDALLNLFSVAGGTAIAAGTGGQSFGNMTQSGGRAAGGPAYGPLSGGIRGRDTIPILAQADEWFLRPQVRRKYGDDFLWALNNLNLPKIDFRKWPKFALGGPVGPEHANGPARLTAEHLHKIGVDSDGMMRFLMGPVFGKVVKDHVKSAPRSIGRVLGARENGR